MHLAAQGGAMIIHRLPDKPFFRLKHGKPSPAARAPTDVPKATRRRQPKVERRRSEY
jgi:hypothetical protein